jgi:ABC-2 type transport system ATP-binding protein
MDEAARCRRLGFLREGRLLVEGTPEDVRARLSGRILEVVGTPLQTLRAHAQADSGVEDAQMFGDRLHLRVAEGAADDVIRRLKSTAPPSMQIVEIRVIPSQLEDVFISLLEADIADDSDAKAQSRKE